MIKAIRGRHGTWFTDGTNVSVEQVGVDDRSAPPSWGIAVQSGVNNVVFAAPFANFTQDPLEQAVGNWLNSEDHHKMNFSAGTNEPNSVNFYYHLSEDGADPAPEYKSAADEYDASHGGSARQTRQMKRTP